MVCVVSGVSGVCVDVGGWVGALSGTQRRRSSHPNRPTSQYTQLPPPSTAGPNQKRPENEWGEKKER